MPGAINTRNLLLGLIAVCLISFAISMMYVNPKLTTIAEYSILNYVKDPGIFSKTYVIDSGEPSKEEQLPPVCKCPKKIKDPTRGLIQKTLNMTDPKHNMTGLESLSRHHPNILLPQPGAPAGQCSLKPLTLGISWMSKYWQSLKDANGRDVLLYSATYDNRTKTVPKGGVVRILALAKKGISGTPICLHWYHNQLEPVPSVARVDYMDWQKLSERQWFPYLLTCSVQSGYQSEPNLQPPPVGVSVVFGACTPASTLLKVNGAHAHRAERQEYQRPREFDGLPEVAVCGPALYYYQENFSLRLVEWLEIMKVLGVSKVFLYATEVHPGIEKVIKFYENEGFLETIDFSYPPPYVDEPLLRRPWTRSKIMAMFALEKIYFNDCILRNMHRYRYIAHFDPDEVPVLLQHPSLPHLMQHLIKRNIRKPSYGLRWLFFPHGASDDQSSDDLYSLVASALGNTSHHSMSSTSASNRNFQIKFRKFFRILHNDRGIINDSNKMHQNMKSIYDTSDVTTVLSHSPFLCASGKKCKPIAYHVGSSLARTGHFRGDCPDAGCGNITLRVMSPIRGLRPRVVPQVLSALERLHFLDKS